MRWVRRSSSLSSRAFRSNVSSSACFLLDADVHQSGDEVGETRRALDALQRRDHFLRHLRQEAQDLDRALLQIERAALDIDVGLDGFVDQLHLRGQHRIAVEELQRAKALYALADHVMQSRRVR